MIIEATVKWKDTGDIGNVLIKVGEDVCEEDDDNIFYYIEDESEIEHYLTPNGVEDFWVIEYSKY